MTRTIKAKGQFFLVVYRSAVERHFRTLEEAQAYIQAGQFPSIYDRRGPSPFRRRV